MNQWLPRRKVWSYFAQGSQGRHRAVQGSEVICPACVATWRGLRETSQARGTLNSGPRRGDRTNKKRLSDEESWGQTQRRPETPRLLKRSTLLATVNRYHRVIPLRVRGLSLSASLPQRIPTPEMIHRPPSLSIACLPPYRRAGLPPLLWGTTSVISLRCYFCDFCYFLRPSLLSTS